jgi:hypothetical protein
MLDWRILTGATLLMGSYLIAEIVEARAQKKAPAGIST